MRSILFIGMYPNEVCKYRNIFFQNLIFAMADLGIDCTVISPVSITKYKFEVKKIPKTEIHLTPLGNRVKVYYPRYISASSKQIGVFNTEKISERLFSNAAVKVARDLIKSGAKFDCVYGHFFLYGGLTAARIGQILDLPSFIAYGECDFESQVQKTYGIPKYKELKGVKGIISVSTDNTNELKKLNFTSDIPIITIPNSVDLTLFRQLNKEECRDRLGIDKDNFIVGFVGGFIERKGDKRLLKALNNLKNIYGIFAGIGDNPPKGAKVLFCKELNHEEVVYFLNAVDVFCLPTLSEGSCNAIIEAMACGCPIISSDLPFNYDILNTQNSILINPLSIEEIEKAILKLYNDTQLREKLKKASLDTAQKRGIKERAECILNFLKEKMVN